MSKKVFGTHLSGLSERYITGLFNRDFLLSVLGVSEERLSGPGSESGIHED